MLLVGNVGINRIRANCSDLIGLRTIPQMIYQPHAFEAVQKGYFYQAPRESERRLARKGGKWRKILASEIFLMVFQANGRLSANMV